MNFGRPERFKLVGLEVVVDLSPEDDAARWWGESKLATAARVEACSGNTPSIVKIRLYQYLRRDAFMNSNIPF